ncbi:oxidoreductase [Actinacidiphila acididurans]|uniref:Oxidoreductase n=1 Tax=Actinacidiphila acididurans TaxID=2784346 RepID=A0ABS2TQC9_9ACTN|nr:oxidoreductase [Actinacidiphila acididurans]
MWRSFVAGRTLDLRTGRAEEDDPLAGPEWPEERTVRARAVAELLLNPPAPAPGRVGALKLAGVRISGRLMLSGGTIAPYFQLDDCRFDEPVMLQEVRAGSMRLVRCLIPRLDAARLQVTGDLHLPQCLVPGGIRMSDAQIGTDLLLNQLVVRRDRASRAIGADGLVVGQDVDAELMDVTGEFSLRSARIGGRLSLRGSSVRNPTGRYALNAARVTVEHTLYLSAGWDAFGGSTPGDTSPPPGVETKDFVCEGGLRLDDGRFGNAVVVTRARFRLGEEQQVSLRRIQTPELRWTPGRAPTGLVSLSGARVGKLVDAPASWPTAPGRLSLRGFVYDGLAPAVDFPLRTRIAWLRSATPEYTSEPYERLAAALRASGDDTEAREVLLAKQRRRRETLSGAGRVWGWIQDVTVGYGYRPGRAAVWMGVLWAIGAVYFALHRTPPPADSNGYQPHWSPALYALDLLLPVIDLGQDNAWRETGVAQWVASALTLLGWMLATTAAAGATRLLRRGT